MFEGVNLVGIWQWHVDGSDPFPFVWSPCD